MTIFVRLTRDENLRFGGTAADLLSFQPDVRGSTRSGEEGEGEVGGGEGEGDGEGGEGEIKSQVGGADQKLSLEEDGGGGGHLESVDLEDPDCCGKPKQPFIMTGEEFDRWDHLIINYWLTKLTKR